MSNFLIFKAAFNNSATPAIGTYTAEGATALFTVNASISPDYYLYNTAGGTAVQWFVPTAETTDFEFVADILTRQWTNRVTYFIIADSTGTTRMRMWSQHYNWFFENSDSDNTSGTEYIGVINPLTSGGFGVFHQFRVRVRKLTASSSSVEVYVDGTLKLTATAGAALVTCAKIGFVGGVNTFGPGTGAGIKNAYVYDLSGGDVIDRGVLSGAFNRFISWMKSKFALKSDIPTVNDATLTIQRNGTNVQTFTANQSTNATANITVPTKTSDLTNDSGFITEDTTKIPLAGSNQISGDLIPATTDAYDLGSPSYQWNNAYIKSLTINGVACGDILTHNASEFVDVSGNQIIGGNKTFSDGDKTFNDSALLRIQGYNKGNEFSANARTVLEIRSNRDTADKSCIYLTKFRQNRAQGSMGSNDNVILTMDVLENEVRTNDLLRFTAHNWINDAPTEVYLEPTAKVSNIQSFLGTPSRPWGDTTTNAINGINPGALSLPSNSYVNVDTTNWDLTCQNELMGSFTPTADGWLMLHIANSGTSEVNFWIIGGVIRINNKSSISTTDNNNFNMFTIPVEKDVTYNIYGNASEYVAGRSIAYCRFMPCRGNV